MMQEVVQPSPEKQDKMSSQKKVKKGNSPIFKNEEVPNENTILEKEKVKRKVLPQRKGRRKMQQRNK